jgi:hypothetical protein
MQARSVEDEVSGRSSFSCQEWTDVTNCGRTGLMQAYRKVTLYEAQRRELLHLLLRPRILGGQPIIGLQECRRLARIA